VGFAVEVAFARFGLRSYAQKSFERGVTNMRFCEGTPGNFHRQVCIPDGIECPCCEEILLREAAEEDLRKLKLDLAQLEEANAIEISISRVV
jgi:hypothetical protein